MAITSITHALNTPPRVTGRTLDPWSDFSGFTNDIKKHLDHEGFYKMYEILVCKISYLWTVSLIRKRLSNSGQINIYHIPTLQLLLESSGHARWHDPSNWSHVWLTQNRSQRYWQFSPYVLLHAEKRIKVLPLEGKQRKCAYNLEIIVW